MSETGTTRRELPLGVACIPHDVLWDAVEVSVDLGREDVGDGAIEVRPHEGRDGASRDLVDEVVLVGRARVDLARRPRECGVQWRRFRVKFQLHLTERKGEESSLVSD